MNSRTISCMVGIVFFAGAAGAEGSFSGKIGFCWPQSLMASSPSNVAELAYGFTVDKKVSYGIAADFLWNVNSNEVKTLSGGHYQIVSEQQAYMFPVMFFFQVDPIPDLIVHPVAHFDIGYNSMIFSYSGTDTNNIIHPLHPYFNGMIVKIGMDGLYDMGKNSAVYLGLEYQWANTSTASTSNFIFDQKNMSGLSLSIGFRVQM